MPTSKRVKKGRTIKGWAVTPIENDDIMLNADNSMQIFRSRTDASFSLRKFFTTVKPVFIKIGE